MNKIVLILIFSMSWLWGVELHTYKEALELQKKSEKIIMLKIVRNDCHYCEDMQKAVCENREMAQWLGKRFIVAKVNLDNEKAPLGIKVPFTPSFYFINKNQEIVKKIPGSWNIQDFKDLTEKIK